jgi:ankyrin repeat protein
VTCRAVGVDARTHDGSTALILACQEGHLGTARCLVEEGGADASAVRASDGKTALMLVIGRRSKYLEAAHCLLRHGARASINAVCSAGGTALSRAAEAGSATLIHVLYSCGADVNLQGMAPQPLMLALNRGRNEVALALIECGADCDNESGYLARLQGLVA